VLASPEPEPLTIRERYRAQVRAEVKQAALAQLAQPGPEGISISAIGKQLGVSGPALYRYFASRDELLTELVIDAYHDLAGALTAATSRVSSHDPGASLEVFARAYRSWALAQPHRYRLLFGPPLPGYDAHAQQLIDAAQKAMNLLLDILGEAADAEAGDGAAGDGAAGDGAAGDGAAGDRASAPPQPLASQLAAWAQPHHPGIDPATALRAVLIWSRMHGIVSLEIAGNFASMGLDPGQLFDTQLATLTT
jgi:AcrR family transcriptional regulator